jgi:hypothetical protein
MQWLSIMTFHKGVVNGLETQRNRIGQYAFNKTWGS